MKTIIAKRDKTVFWFILVLTFLSWLISYKNIISFLNSDFRLFGIFYIAGLSIITFVTILGVILLPNATIIKKDESLIIYKGVFKKIIDLNNVLSAELAPIQKNEKISKNGNVILRVKTESGEEIILITQVKDKENAVKQINDLITHSI